MINCCVVTAIARELIDGHLCPVVQVVWCKGSAEKRHADSVVTH